MFFVSLHRPTKQQEGAVCDKGKRCVFSTPCLLSFLVLSVCV